MDKAILNRINKIGFAASLIGKVACGDVCMANGDFPVDDVDVYETMSKFMLVELDKLVDFLENNNPDLHSINC